MQAYRKGFARVYNIRWGGFARQVAPYLIDFYASTSVGREKNAILDLCCGAGHLAAFLLERGYRVVGLDLSEDMLYWAKENARSYVASGQAVFVQGDASDFTFEERFGLVISMYDALNHLADEQALRRCFQCVYAVSDGYFIFDLNTRRGLRRWNNIQIDDSDEEVLIVQRGIYDELGNKAWMRISGFVRLSDGFYERFEETVFNTAFDMEQVKRCYWRLVGQRPTLLDCRI